MILESQKWHGLSPISIMSWGLRAPRPRRDFVGITPPNSPHQGNKKAHGLIYSMSSLLLMRSRQPDYLSDDSIPTRVLPSRAASALNRH
jgi:hypothetical protein